MNMSQAELLSTTSFYSSVSIDIGTGDGKRLYRVAQKNPDIFFIGIDPMKDNMAEISKKANRKPNKGGINNLLLVIGSVEHLPEELNQMADDITVYFPWGSLLECIVKPIEESMSNIAKIAKDAATFTFVTTYSSSYEGNEIDKRQLPEISKSYFEGVYAKLMAKLGLVVEEVTEMTSDDAKAIGTQWAKRLSSGRSRSYYQISGHVKKENQP